MRLSHWSLASKVVALTAAVALASSSANSQVVAIGSGAFAASPPPLTFDSPAIGTEVNGLSLSGFQFAYSLGSAQLAITTGPGLTNNVSDPSIVSVGANNGVLTIILPSLSNQFGFGFALLAQANLAFGTSVTVLNGATSLGNLLYAAPLDPLFAGGFAGIRSVSAFDRVQLSFNSASADAFAVDNLVYTSVVPEPSSLLLTACGIGALWFSYRRRNTKLQQ